MKHVVGVSDMLVSDQQDDVIVTHSLGSCIGVAIHDAKARIGGMLHFQLPLSRESGEKAANNPYMCADTGIPALFHAAYSLGAEKKRIVVKVAGGSTIMDRGGVFNIGQRNYVAMRKLFWKNGILISAEDVGGDAWRTMTLEVASGKTFIRDSEREFEL
jgi:chemotaxis protein CheD